MFELAESYAYQPPLTERFPDYVQLDSPLTFKVTPMNVPSQVLDALVDTDRNRVIAKMRSEAYTADKRADDAQRQLGIEVAALKAKVGRTAMQYAREHGWCSVVREALGDMGITPPSEKYRGTITVTLPFQGTWTGDGTPENYSVNVSMDDTYDTHNGLPVFGLHLDDDEWSDVTFDYDSAEVSGLEAQED